jgi:hypothetical protein
LFLRMIGRFRVKMTLSLLVRPTRKGKPSEFGTDFGKKPQPSLNRIPIAATDHDA